MSLRVKGATDYATAIDDNQINTISIFSFSRKPGEAEYTYEKNYLDLVPITNGDQIELTLSLDGSLPRILYMVANDVSKIAFLNSLQSGTTSDAMEELALIFDQAAPRPPHTMVAKAALPVFAPETNLSVEFTHTLSRLDIVNRYEGFTVDSMIVRDAMLGTHAFKELGVLLGDLSQADVKYTESPIYIYETNHSVLSIYGKYKDIRAVFDIDLNDIKKATRYNVIFRSTNDHDLNVSANLIWKVEPWIKNDEIDSTPDWKF